MKGWRDDTAALMEMDAADPKELAAKVAKATDILYKVGFQR